MSRNKGLKIIGITILVFVLSSAVLILSSCKSTGLTVYSVNLPEEQITYQEQTEYGVMQTTCDCVNCSNCTDALNNPNCDIVNLLNNISINGTTCINSPANFINKILDCKGYTIKGNKTSNTRGIYIIGKNNNTIKNCIVTNFAHGILISTSHYNNLTNITVYNTSSDGIGFSSSNNNVLYDATVYDSSNNGIGTSATTNNTFTNIHSYRNRFGVYLHTSKSNLTNVIVRDNSDDGIMLSSSTSNSLANITSYNNGDEGIDLWVSSGNNLTNITVYENTVGISFYLNSNNNIINNITVRDNSGKGVYLHYYSKNNHLTDINIYNSSNGIYLLNASHNTFQNNTIINNSVSEIFFEKDSVNNTFTNQQISSYPTNISFFYSLESYSGNLKINGVDSPPTNPSYKNISKYVNITNSNGPSWLFLNISYSNSDLPILFNESTLKIWKYNGTWHEDDWNTTRVFDESNNIVGVNITNFGSIFAPLGNLYPYACQNCSDCNSKLNSGYSTIYLANNISATGSCINISVDSKTFDCQNNIINGDGTGSGIFIPNKQSNTIQNCMITNFSDGIAIYSGSYNTITGSTIFNNTDDGIYVEESSNNVINNNNIANNNDEGIFVWGVVLSQQTITGNTISYNGDRGVYLLNENLTAVTNNRIYNNTYGVYLGMSLNNEITDNNIFNNTDYAVYLSSSDDNVIDNNNITTSGDGVYLSSSNNNNITNNNASNNEGYGIYLTSSSNNIITNITTYNNSQYGIYLSSLSNNNILQNNILANNTASEIFIANNSTNNTFTNQRISSYPTNISFIYSPDSYTGNLTIRGIDIPPPDPSYGNNISKYINITNSSGPKWLFLNISYSDDDITNAGITESTLKIWRHNGSWQESGWNTTRILDTTNKVVGVNITNFGSIFAPLGSTLPTVCFCNGCGSVGLSSCGRVLNNISCDIVKLTQDSSTDETCIDDPINFSNKIFDGQGFTITSGITSTGINLSSNQENITIKNLVIEDFSEYGIYITSINNITLLNITFKDNVDYALYVNNSLSNSTLENLTFYRNDEYAIYANSISDSTLTNINISKSTYGIYIYDLSDSTLKGINSSNNYDDGIQVTNDITDCNFTDITANHNDYRGIYMNLVYDSNFTDITTNFNGLGTHIDYLDNCKFLHMNSSGNTDERGIFITDDIRDSTFTDITTNSNTIYGFYVGDDIRDSNFTDITSNNVDNGYGFHVVDIIDNSVFTNININDNDDGGMHMGALSNSQFTNMVCNNNPEYGIEISYNSDYNAFTNITINGSEYGFYAEASLISYSNFTNMTTNNNGAGIRIDGLNHCRFIHVNSSNNIAEAGIYIDTDIDNSVFTDVTINNNDEYGIYAGASTISNSNFTDITADNNGAGIDVDYIDNCNFTHISASNNTAYRGINIDNDIGDSTFTDITTNYNDDYGFYIHGTTSNSVFTNMTSSGNTGPNSFGIYVGQDMDTCDFTDITTNNHTDSGFYVGGTTLDSKFIDITSCNNPIFGFYLFDADSNNITTITACHVGLGIYLGNTGSNTLTNALVYNATADRGIYLDSMDDNTLTNILVYDVPNDIGIDSSGSNNVFRNVTIHDSGGGLDVDGDYNTFSNLTIYNINEVAGLYIDSLEYSTFTNLTVYNNTADSGIYISSSSHNTFTNVICHNNTPWDWESDSITNITVINFTSNQNKLSFIPKDISLKGLMPIQAPSNPSIYSNINKWINAINNDVNSWLFVNFSYSDSDIGLINESTIKIWKHDGTAWQEDGWNGTRILDEANNIVGVNITNFQSTYAPFGECSCVNCSDCEAKLNNPACNAVRLTTNIITTGTCIDAPVNFTNKIFDCNGHTIHGDRTGQGINLSNLQSNTIRNCMLTNFTNGIHSNYSSNNLFTNITIYNNVINGIYVNSAYNTTFSYIITYDNHGGIDVDEPSSNCIFRNITAYDNSDNGILIEDYLSNGSITNITAYHNGRAGIYIGSSNSSNLTHINSFDNIGDGIETDMPFYNCRFIDITTINNSAGLYIEDKVYDSVFINITSYNNTGTGGEDDGIYIFALSNCNLTNIVSSNNEEDGIQIGELGHASYNCTFTNITTNNNGENGFNTEEHIYNSIFTNITSTYNKGGTATAGVYFYRLSNCNVTNINSSNNANDGIETEDPFYNVIFTDIYTNNNGAVGFLQEFEYVYNSSFTNIISKNNTDQGMYVGGFSNCNLTDVVLSNNGDNGFETEQAFYNCRIINITADNNTGSGLYIEDPVHTSVLANITCSRNKGTDGGFYVVSINKTNLTNLIVYNSSDVGITIDDTSDDNVLTHIKSYNNSDDGIFMYELLNSTIINMTSHDNGDYGIYLRGISDSTIINLTSYNNVDDGFYLRSLSKNNLTNLISYNNYDYGIYVYRSDDCIFTDLNVHNNTAWDFYSDDDSDDNTIKNLTISSSYPTSLTFTYLNGIKIKSVESPATAPSGKTAISKYANLSNYTATSSINLNISYSDSDITNNNIEESSLRIYKYNGAWTQITSTVDTTNNTVSANITSFSDFGIFGTIPVEEVEEVAPPARAGGRLTICTEQWNCSDWGPCMPDGKQHRNCWDLNKCEEKYTQRIVNYVKKAEKPAEVRDCVYEATCNDGVQNQDETDTDCGGICGPTCKDGQKCKSDDDCINTCNLEEGICYTLPIVEIPAPPTLWQRFIGYLSNKAWPFIKTRFIIIKENISILLYFALFMVLMIVIILTYEKYGRKLSQRFHTYLQKQQKEKEKRAEIRKLTVAKLRRQKKLKEERIRREAIRREKEKKRLEKEKLGLKRYIEIKKLEEKSARLLEKQRLKRKKELERIEKTKKKERERRKLEKQKELERERIEKLKKKEIIKKSKKEYSAELNKFFKNAIAAGYTKEQIKKALLEKGWPKRFVNKYCNKFFEVFER